MWLLLLLLPLSVQGGQETSTAGSSLPSEAPVTTTADGLAINIPPRPPPAPVREKPKNTTRAFDIMHIFKDDIDFNSEVSIKVTVFDSTCYGSATDSSFVIFLAALDFENHLLDMFPIHSRNFTRNKLEGKRVAEIKIKELRFKEDNVDEHAEEEFYESAVFTEDPEACLEAGIDPCVPRADVIFLQYHNEPNDEWSISHITVDVSFRLWVGQENTHQFHYEHSLLKPCDDWLRSEQLVQIGPRNGLFIELDKMPLKGDWVRDWV